MELGAKHRCRVLPVVPVFIGFIALSWRSVGGALPLDTDGAIFTNVKSYNETRRAVLTLMRRGTVTVPEAAQLAGVSRHLIRHWCKVGKIVVGQSRAARIAKEWRRVMDRGQE